MRDLFDSISKLSTNNDVKPDFFSILDIAIRDLLEVWEFYKRNNYYISEREEKEIKWKIQKYQRRLDELIEKSGIFKQCSKCHVEFPATTKFFYKDRRAKDGLRSECKQCHNKAKKITYYRKKEKILEDEIGYKKTGLKSIH